MERREIPGRSWRAIAPAGCWSRTLKAVWQYCRRSNGRPLRCPCRGHGYQPILQDARLEVGPDELEDALIPYPPSQPTHEPVVTHPIERSIILMPPSRTQT